MRKVKLIINHVYYADFDPNEYFSDPLIWTDYQQWLDDVEDEDCEENRWEYIDDTGRSGSDSIGVSNIVLDHEYTEYY